MYLMKFRKFICIRYINWVGVTFALLIIKTIDNFKRFKILLLETIFQSKKNHQLIKSIIRIYSVLIKFYYYLVICFRVKNFLEIKSLNI